jgi:hydroxyacylglutathione hydrolase
MIFARTLVSSPPQSLTNTRFVMPIEFETITNGPFQENCYLVWDDEVMTGILIDPGDEPDRILAFVESKGVSLEGIFNTHGHLDHAGGVAAIVRELNIPFALHPGDLPLVNSIKEQAAAFGMTPTEIPRVDRELSDGDVFTIGGHTVKTYFTPGHTQGGVCFHVGNLLFVGDTLFQGSIGRTDLPGGSHPQLLKSIRDRLLPLDDWTQVMSGHGPFTTIGFERTHNPFLQM